MSDFASIVHALRELSPEDDCPYDTKWCDHDDRCKMCLEDGPAEGESQDAFESRRSGVPQRGPI